MPEEATSGRELLRVDELHAWYGESHILHGMTFAVAEGELVTLLGRNGAGKTTTLKAIIGIVPQRRGSVGFRGTELVGLASNRIARLGIAYCPEERGIFSSLDVEENLLLLDEPTEGLAPVIVQQIGAVIRTLKQRGFTILLVEQNFHFAATLADRHYVVEHGRVVDLIRNVDLARNLDKLHQYLGV